MSKENPTFREEIELVKCFIESGLQAKIDTEIGTDAHHFRTVLLFARMGLHFALNPESPNISLAYPPKNKN